MTLGGRFVLSERTNQAVKYSTRFFRKSCCQASSVARCLHRRWLNTPQIIWTADDAHENTTGERCGVSPPVQPRAIDDDFQNTHSVVSDRSAC